MYIHKCFKPSKCLTFGTVLAHGEHGYMQKRCNRRDWHSARMDDCNGNFIFLVLQKLTVLYLYVETTLLNKHCGLIWSRFRPLLLFITFCGRFVVGGQCVTDKLAEVVYHAKGCFTENGWYFLTWTRDHELRNNPPTRRHQYWSEPITLDTSWDVLVLELPELALHRNFQHTTSRKVLVFMVVHKFVALTSCVFHYKYIEAKSSPGIH